MSCCVFYELLFLLWIWWTIGYNTQCYNNIMLFMVHRNSHTFIIRKWQKAIYSHNIWHLWLWSPLDFMLTNQSWPYCTCPSTRSIYISANFLLHTAMLGQKYIVWVIPTYTVCDEVFRWCLCIFLSKCENVKCISVLGTLVLVHRSQCPLNCLYSNLTTSQELLYTEYLTTMFVNIIRLGPLFVSS